MRLLYRILPVLLLFSEAMFSQSSSSPYTIFGAGEIKDYGFGIQHAMGGTGIALPTSKSLNNLNPASYSGIDTLSFLFDVGLEGKFVNYETNTSHQSKFNGNIRYLAMGFRVLPWWASSVGILPYSSVGYNINSTAYIEGDLTPYSKVYSGSGGINQFYIGNSFKLNKYISAGFHASYLFGSVTRSEAIETSLTTTSYKLEKNQNLKTLYLDYGLQFSTSSSNLNYSLGLVYGQKQNCNLKGTSYLASSSGDTTFFDNTNEKFLIPAKYGIGLAVSKEGKFKAAVDYLQNNWSDLTFKNEIIKTTNNNRYSAGFEFVPSQRISDRGWKRYQYRIGAYYKTSYLEISDARLETKAVTFGMGLPIKGGKTMLNLSFEFGQDGTKKNGLILENYFLVHLNFSINEFWFMKRKFD